MNALRPFIAAAAALVLSPAGMAETWATFGFLSLHDQPGYNGENYGLGIEQDVGERVAVVAGKYRNSRDLPSQYAGVTFASPLTEGVDIAITAGVVDGYPDDCDWKCRSSDPFDDSVPTRGPHPLLLPTIQLNGQRFGANIALAPPIGKDGATAIAIQFKVRLR